MSRSELISKLLPLDPHLAIRVLRNERLAARLKVATLLKELNLQVKQP
jgi:hypothetical protein